MKKINFIGVTGFAQSGKDEIVKILNTIGFTRVSLADPVRQGIYNINPFVFIPFEFKHLVEEISPSKETYPYLCVYRLKDIVDKIGWDNAKKITEVRRLLQYYGTEGARDIFGDSIWTDTADKYIKENNIKKIAISDIRFENELKWLKSKQDSFLIKVKRPGIGPINSHSSDLGINDNKCDIVIENNGTLEELKIKILTIFN